MQKMFLMLLIAALSAFAGITLQPWQYIDTDNPRTAVFIHWEGGEGTVYFSIDSSYSLSITGIDYVHLTGLAPSMRYNWFLVVDGDTSEMGSFQLDPGPGGRFKAVLLGDTQFLDTNVVKFFQYAYTVQPDIIAILGDLMTMDNSMCGGCEDWHNVFNRYPKLFANALFVPVIGNHDAKLLEWQAHFPHIPNTVYPSPLPQFQTGVNYFMDYGNITFCIDEGSQGKNYLDVGGTYSWSISSLKSWWTAKLNERIANNTLRPIVIELSHYPKYGACYYRSELGSTFQNRRCLAMYGGHLHWYSRTKWLKMSSTYCGGIVDTSDVQADSHMVYIVAGQAAGTATGCAADSAIAAYQNCGGAIEDGSRLMRILEAAGDGMIYHRAFRVLNAAGNINVEHAVLDSLNIDGRQLVSDYFITTGAGAQETQARGITVSVSPNPFKPNTRITGNRQLATDGEEIEIEVFNVYGKLVRKLSASYYQLNTGITWDASGQPSGIYFIQVRAGQYTVIQKAVLAR